MFKFLEFPKDNFPTSVIHTYHLSSAVSLLSFLPGPCCSPRSSRSRAGCPHRTPPWEALRAQVPLLARVPPLGLCWAPALGPHQAPLTVWWDPALVPPPLDTPSRGPLDMARTTCTLCTKWGYWQHLQSQWDAPPILLVGPLANERWSVSSWVSVIYLSRSCETY